MTSTVLHDHIVDEVAVCLSGDDLHRIEAIARLCEEEGKIVRIPVDDFPVSLPGGRVEDFDRGKVMSLAYGPDRVISFVVKRLIDLALGLVASILLLPLFAIVALAIAALDGRPIIFRQTRVGLHGRPFQVVKFRTMVPDAEAQMADLTAHNEIRGRLQADQRSTHVPDGEVPAQDEHRRAAPALERAPRRDEPRRPTPPAPDRGREL